MLPGSSRSLSLAQDDTALWAVGCVVLTMTRHFCVLYLTKTCNVFVIPSDSVGIQVDKKSSPAKPDTLCYLDPRARYHSLRMTQSFGLLFTQTQFFNQIFVFRSILFFDVCQQFFAAINHQQQSTF